MQVSTLKALTMGILLVFSALAGCIDADNDGGDNGDDQTILVSTYHIEQLVSAIAQDSVNVEIISPSNVPVHDYEPSAMDLVNLQQADLFFYHGLNLEPWVDSTLESLGVDSPNAISTHSMPTGESNLDYESLLIGDICEHLSEGPYEDVELSESSEHADDVELHAEHVAFNLSFHFEDDEGHDHNETEEHDEHDHEEGEHDEHDEHGIEAEEVEESPAECPTDTNVYLFHFEEGEYMIEFIHHDVDSFNMVILQMDGAHNHEHDHDEEEGEHDEHDHDEEEGEHDEHDHDEESEHDEHDHDEEGEHDEHDHGEEEEITAEHALEEFDTNNDSHLSWDEFWASWEEDEHDENTTSNNTSDNQTSSNETHDEDHEDEMEHLMEMFNDSDMDSDGLLNMTELEEFIEHLMDEFFNEDHADGYAILHIEEEGEYGIGVHADIDFAIIGEEHDEHDHEEEGEHDEHDHEEEGEHDEHDHDEEGVAFDPHSWLDPLAYKAQLEIVLEAMVIAFPTLEDTFRANALEYSNQLDGLHSNFEEAFGENGVCTERTVVANHNAYAYMAERYDLEFVTVHGIDPEGEPSAEDIAEVIEEINEEGITVLFIEEYTSADAVSSIVSQTTSDDLPNGISVEYLYTMELPPTDSTQNYLSLMQSNLDNLKSGLGC